MVADVRRLRAPSWSYFIGSAVFHYLGPAFAVLLFSRVAPLGVAGLRIWSAGLVFALWRRPWRALARLDRDGRRTVLAWGAVLAAMNSCFYLAIDRLPLGTVAAIEFLPVIALAAFGAIRRSERSECRTVLAEGARRVSDRKARARTGRNLAALACAVAGVYALTDVRLAGQPLGFVLAFANAALFAAYIVLAHRAARRLPDGVDALAAAMLAASLFVVPLGAWQAAPAFADPIALAAGIGVGVSSSVIPYICDQLAMARMPRATYALMVALLPATATVIGVLVLRQLPTPAEITGVGLIVVAIAVHRDRG